MPALAQTPQFVAVEGVDEKNTRAIKEKLGDKYTNQPLDKIKQTEIAEDLSDLKGTGRFDSLDYGFVQKDGRTGLLISPSQIGESASTPLKLELGFDVNSVESDNVNFNFLMRLTVYDVGSYGAEWRNDVRIGSNTLLATEYFRPLGKKGFFFAPRASYERRRINLFDNGNRLAEYSEQTAQAGIDLGYTFSSKSELRAGYTFGYQNISRRIGDSALPNLKGKYSALGLRWNYDGLDKSQVPTRGIWLRNAVNYYFNSPGVSEKFTQAEMRFNVFKPSGKRSVAFAFGGGGASLGGNPSPVRQFTLGGPFQLGGYGYEEFRADNYLLGGGGVLYNPKFFPEFLGGKAYLGAWYEGGSAFEKFSRANYRQSVSGGVVFETPLGPVLIGGSVNENSRGRFYFSLGRIFK